MKLLQIGLVLAALSFQAGAVPPDSSVEMHENGPADVVPGATGADSDRPEANSNPGAGRLTLGQAVKNACFIGRPGSDASSDTAIAKH